MSELDPAKKTHRAKQVITWLLAIAAIVAAIVVGALFGRRLYILVSVIVVIIAMIPFFVSFEKRRPQARELVTLAVMIALAVASRAVFAFVPFFKPMAAVVMITGIAFGAPAGFLTGALAAFVSNFIFGQGPWTPFQMLAIGLCGFVFGFLADRGVIARGSWSWKMRLAVSFAGGFFILLVAGPVLDTSSLFWMISSITPASIATVYLAGVPVNAIHGVATFVTLLLVANPILEKLNRLKVKYGFME